MMRKAGIYYQQLVDISHIDQIYDARTRSGTVKEIKPVLFHPLWKLLYKFPGKEKQIISKMHTIYNHLHEITSKDRF